MNPQFPDDLSQVIERSGVIAVLVIDRAEHAVPLANALLDGGIRAMELTLRTPAAIDALREIVADVPEMLAGIGTILTPEQVTDVTSAGAAFGVSPGFNPRVVQAAQRAGLPFAPGVATPSDIEAALELGCTDLKFFPAEPSGGLGYLKSMATPYQHLGIRFIPLGGVNADNMQEYLRSPWVMAVGGSWIAPRELIVDRNWAEIKKRAQQAGTLVNSVAVD